MQFSDNFEFREIKLIPKKSLFSSTGADQRDRIKTGTCLYGINFLFFFFFVQLNQMCFYYCFGFGIRKKKIVVVVVVQYECRRNE